MHLRATRHRFEPRRIRSTKCCRAMPPARRLLRNARGSAGRPVRCCCHPRRREPARLSCPVPPASETAARPLLWPRCINNHDHSWRTADSHVRWPVGLLAGADEHVERLALLGRAASTAANKARMAVAKANRRFMTFGKRVSEQRAVCRLLRTNQAQGDSWGPKTPEFLVILISIAINLSRRKD
jgi:hypothetical protein